MWWNLFELRNDDNEALNSYTSQVIYDYSMGYKLKVVKKKIYSSQGLLDAKAKVKFQDAVFHIDFFFHVVCLLFLHFYFITCLVFNCILEFFF